MNLHPRVGGLWMGSIAPFGDVAYSTGEKGCLEASFGFYLPPGVQHSAFRRGAALDLMDASDVRWAGVVAEVDYAEGTIVGHGYAGETDRFQAVDGSNNPTTVPSTAVDVAMGKGWGVLGRTGVPTTAYVSGTAGMNSVTALLDPVANELGQWWRVEEDRVVRMAGAATVPTWQIVPGAVVTGTADDDYASALQVYYQTGISTYDYELVADTDVAARFGYREEPVDLTPLGVITSGRAIAIGQGILLKGRSRLGWTQGFDVSSSQLLTMGGAPADLSLVKSHQMVRVHGINDDLQFLFGRTYLDVVIGGTNYADGADVISLSPMGSVATTADEIVAKLAAAS